MCLRSGHVRKLKTVLLENSRFIFTGFGRRCLLYSGRYQWRWQVCSPPTFEKQNAKNNRLLNK